MLFSKIWEKYFLKQTLKVCFLLLFCFYGLYFLIDYTSRSSQKTNAFSSFALLHLLQYYLYEFIQRMDVILPFVLLIATLRVLIRLSQQNEWIALLSSGVNMKTLARPFIALGMLAVLMVYINFQFLTPHALKKMRHINDHATLKKSNNKPAVNSLSLRDHTVVLFHEFDPSAKKFFDVYWIKSFDDVYHMKYLFPDSTPPLGVCIDHITRDEEGRMSIASSSEKQFFPDMRFNRKLLLETVRSPKELSLTKLWEHLPKQEGLHSEKQAQIATLFYQRLAMPWLCLIAVIVPLPFAIKFSRHMPGYFLYAVGIFGLAAFITVVDAASILGSRQAVSPPLAIGIPFFFGLLISFACYFRLK